MTCKEFEKDRVNKLLEGSFIWIVFDSVMKTRQTIDFQDYFDFSYNKNICFYLTVEGKMISQNIKYIHFCKAVGAWSKRPTTAEIVAKV